MSDSSALKLMSECYAWVDNEQVSRDFFVISDPCFVLDQLDIPVGVLLKFF